MRGALLCSVLAGDCGSTRRVEGAAGEPETTTGDPLEGCVSIATLRPAQRVNPLGAPNSTVRLVRGGWEQVAPWAAQRCGTPGDTLPEE